MRLVIVAPSLPSEQRGTETQTYACGRCGTRSRARRAGSNRGWTILASEMMLAVASAMVSQQQCLALRSTNTSREIMIQMIEFYSSDYGRIDELAVRPTERPKSRAQ
jgi:hypothetical protein